MCNKNSENPWTNKEFVCKYFNRKFSIKKNCKDGKWPSSQNFYSSLNILSEMLEIKWPEYLIRGQNFWINQNSKFKIMHYLPCRCQLPIQSLFSAYCLFVIRFPNFLPHILRQIQGLLDPLFKKRNILKYLSFIILKSSLKMPSQKSFSTLVTRKTGSCSMWTWMDKKSNEPTNLSPKDYVARQANLCLRAFRHDKF